MKTILVFTYGDANNPKTWSNVPYLFTKALEKKGIKVIKIDISTKQNIFMYLYSLICKIIKPETTYYFVKSKWNLKIVEKKIKKAIKQYDNEVDAYISISFDFSPNKYTNKKVLLISDWPISYAIEKRFQRKPDFLEKRDIKLHKEIIENATYRISLFKDVAEYMNKNYNCHTEYISPLINSFYPIKDFDKIENRNKITFIGKKSYYQSAIKLIKAFQKISIEKLELHIIGMNQNDFPQIKNKTNIYFHGYLDKGNKKEQELYYQILKETLVIVNTNNKWAGMSSILESMYYYRPIITSPYDEFVKTFSKKINFGYYSENTEQDIHKNLKKIINLTKEEYKKMSFAAHNSVKEFTYDKYTDKVLDYINQ